MENAQTNLMSSRLLDRADYLQTGTNPERDECEIEQIRFRPVSAAFSASEQRMFDEALYKKQQWQARAINQKICNFRIPVSCKHADNFHFHPGLKSPKSHGNGALVTECR